MPKLIVFIFALLPLLATASSLGSPRREVSWEAHHVEEGRPLQVRSPLGLATLLAYDGAGCLSLGSADRRTMYERRVVPPVSALWSGSGRFLALNDGEGSGQTSRLILLDLAQNRPSPDRRPERDLRTFFLQRTGCASPPDLISVAAWGWSSTAPELWVSFEAWDRERLCEHDAIAFARYDLGRHRIVEVLSRRLAYARFCRDSGFARRFAPNCESAALGRNSRAASAPAR